MARQCSRCGKYDADMNRCSRCKTVFYCSRACQRKHWPSHKADCSLSSQHASEDCSNQAQRCTNCKTLGGGNLKSCAGCRAVVYCSKPCQREDWPKHKVNCKRSSQNTGTETPKPGQFCGNCKNSDGLLKRCTGCKVTAYCSKSCQLQHWLKHKCVCALLRQSNNPESDESQNCNTVGGQQPEDNDGQEWQFAVVRDNRTGAMFLEKQCPPPEFSLPPVPYPDVAELSRVVDRLKASLPQPVFFHLPAGERFRYITDLNDVMPEWCPSVLHMERNTVLVAKIVEMDEYWTRHGICIKGDETGKPVIVHFYMPRLNPLPFFKWSDAVPGNYICIRVPVIHSFLDGQSGFRIDHASHVRILSPTGHLVFGI